LTNALAYSDEKKVYDLDDSPNPEYGTSLENCTQKCYGEVNCNYWTFVEPNGTCYYIVTVGSMVTVDVNETGATYYSAVYTCLTPIAAPALPEDAQVSML
jgi:hypothetical protein